jgi:hypothetical protein
MSVALDRPENLHPLRRPVALGGTGKDPVWSLDPEQLGPDLQRCEDSPTHGLIEPAREMSLDEYQQKLGDTKPLWKRVP